MKKRNQVLIFLTVLMMSALCACSAMNTTGDKNDIKKEGRATGSAVTGSTVTGSGANAADDWEPSDGSRNATLSGETYYDMKSPANNYLDLLYESGNTKQGLVQYTKDGKKRGEIIFPKLKDVQDYFYMYADDSGMVYSISDRMEDTFTVYYLPFAKDGDGNDVIDPGKSQKLFCEKFCHFEMDVYVDAHYIIFFNMKGKYIRYERDTEKLVEEYPFGKGAEVELDPTAAQGREIYCYVYDEETGDNLCCQDLATMEWKILRENVGTTFADVYFPSQGYVLFVEDDSETEGHTYYYRDVEKDRFFCLLSKDQLLQKACEEGLIREDEKKLCEELTIGGWFLSRGRLYVQYRMAIFRELTCQIENAVFSVGVEGTDLAYERGLSEYMRKEGCYQCCIWHEGREFVSGKARKTDRDIKLRANAAECRDIRGTTAIFVYVTPDGDLGCGGYDLAAGKPATLTKKEKRGVLEEELFENYDDVESLVPSVISHDSEMDLTDFNYER